MKDDDQGLDVIQVTKKFAEQIILDDVSLSVKPEQHTVILGESGCGKSTLLRIISGLSTPDAGEIRIDGHQASSAYRILVQPHLRNIALVFQDLALWSNLSVFDNISLVLSAKKSSSVDINKKVQAVLDMCGIVSIKDRNPTEISGGQQQREALARAIISQPKYLLLDEPFSGVDLVTKHDLMDELVALADKQKITIILITHDPFEATFFAKQALILTQGKIEASGLFKDLLAHSQNPIMLKFRSQLEKVDYK